MSELDQPAVNTIRQATEVAKLAELAAKRANLPEAQVDAAKATAIGTITALRSVTK